MQSRQERVAVGEDNEKRLALKIKHREDELSQAKTAHKKQVRMPRIRYECIYAAHIAYLHMLQVRMPRI